MARYARFTVALSQVSAQEVTCRYQTVPGSALAGSDYVNTQGQLTFPPGTQTQTVFVQIREDIPGNVEERFYLRIFDIAGALTSREQGTAILPSSVASNAQLSISGQAPNGIVGEFYSFTYTIVLGTAPLESLELAPGSGPLPPGLAIDLAGNLVGEVTADGTYTYTLRGTDANGASFDLTDTVVFANPA